MGSDIIITKYNGKRLTIILEESYIRQIHVESPEEEGILGNVYVGRVRNIVKNINAAFVEYKKGQMGYLPLDNEKSVMHTCGKNYTEGRILIGDEIIVQVQKEAIKTKLPTLSGVIDIPGKYAVLVSEKGRLSISSKITEKDKRERLYGLLENYITDEYGFIARTNSADAGLDVLSGEIGILIKKYKNIVDFGKHKDAFTCLYTAPAGYIADILNAKDSMLERIITDDKEVYDNIYNSLYEISGLNEGKLILWDDSRGRLDAVFNIQKTLERALMPKVWLKSGAYIIIQPTEALVSIDVNTGKAISKKKDVQKTFLKVNLEAAKEIAHQLRLRNLSGIILIDFIDMAEEKDNREVINELKKELAKDNVYAEVVDMTKLGLVEVTRKKVRKPLFEQVCGKVL